MDEPLASLDMGLRGRILRYLKDIHLRLGIPMVYVSHSISEVLAIAHSALVISHGKQLAFDEPRKVLLEPFIHPLVESGSLENLLDLEVVERRPDNGLTGASLGGDLLWIAGAPPHISAGDIISVAIRAGDIIVAVDRPSRISARNVIKSRIEGIHRVDSRVILYTAVGVGSQDTASLLVEITSEALDSLELREEEEVFLVIKSSSILVLG
jgi:molybdate transport system ATP-binding protein